MKKLIVILLLLPTLLFSVNFLPPAQLLYMGQGANGIALGGNGITQFGSIEGVLYNPAVTGDFRRLSISTSFGGFGTGNTYGFLGASLPTLFGVWTGGITYLGSSSDISTNVGTVVGVNGALAKPITDKLFFGIGLKAGYGNSEELGGDFALNLDLGLYLKTFPDLLNRTYDYGDENTNMIKDGFGLYDLTLGFVVKNLGKNITYSSSDYTASPPLTFGVGASIYPIKYDIFKLKVLSDLSVPVAPFNINWNVGLEASIFDIVYGRTGFLLSLDEFGIPKTGPLSLGAGVKLNIKYTDIKLDVAYLPQSFSGNDNSGLFFTLGAGIGYYDDKPPKTEFEPEYVYFSPNFDGSQDSLKIDFGAKDNQMVKGWKVEVLDANNNLVKEFQSENKLKETLTPSRFFKKVISKESEVNIPQEIEWDGIDKDGQRASDGRYTYKVYAWDRNDNTNESSNVNIYIDTVYPEVDIAVDRPIFSPNDDNSRDTLYITNNFTMNEGDIADVEITDKNGNVVKTISYTNTMEKVTPWDGKNNVGKVVNEGTYKYNVKIYDRAGNINQRNIAEVDVVREYEEVETETSVSEFAPTGNGINDNITFTQDISSTNGISKWALNITDKNGSVVKTFSGDDSISDTIIWNGIDNNGNKVSDGEYTYNTRIDYDSGNFPISESNKFTVDTTPPSIKISSSGKAFSPDGDGQKDTITFPQDIADYKDSDTFELSVKDEVGNVVYNETYDADNFPKEFVWNGHINNNTKLEKATDGIYKYSVLGRDSVGNTKVALVDEIILDTGDKEVNVESDKGTFSPNADSKKDIVYFPVDVKDNTGIADWSFNIVNSESGQNVYTKSGTSAVDSGFQWRGYDADGNIVSDGKYDFLLNVNYESGKNASSQKKSVYLDTTPPKVDITPEYKAFSPNGDGKKESISFNHKRDIGRAETFTGVVKNSSGSVVRTFSFDENIPEQLVWDGRNSSGNIVPSGNYTYQITGTDDGDNVGVMSSQPVKLVDDFENITAQIENQHFSPNADNLYDTTKIMPSLNRTDGIESWSIDIVNDEGMLVKTFSGEGELQESLWDGKNNNNKDLPNQTYSATIKANFDSGNEILFSTNIVLDTTPPDVKLNLSPTIFSPDEDGENDTLFMNVGISDISDVESYEILIYPYTDKKLAEKPFKTFSGEGEISELINWDGYGDDRPRGVKNDKYLVDSASDYAVVIKAVDKIGNEIITDPEPFYVDILVIKTPNGYKIRISSIQFDVDKASIKSQYKGILDRLAQVLNKYNHHTVRIEGHTDKQGSDKYNESLSLRRAKSVEKYLIGKGLEEDRFNSEGVGKKRPLYDETGEDIEKQRAQNRRVEFYLER